MLTEKQRHVFQTLCQLIEREERPPTTRELASEMNCHIKTVYQYLQALEKEGAIEHRRGRIFVSRSFRRKGLPVLGRIAAGIPNLVDEQFNQFLSLDELFTQNGDFVLRVTGDSMIGAHICDGDRVIVHQQPHMENGEIAVVLIGDEATVKRIYVTEKTIRLIPENDSFTPLEYDRESADLKIIGKVIGVVRTIR